MHRELHCIMRIKGHLSCHWSDWLSLSIRHLPNGQSELSGVLPDSAALYGVLNRLRDLDALLLELHVEEISADSRPPKGPEMGAME